MGKRNDLSLDNYPEFLLDDVRSYHSGFYQEAADQKARQGYMNAKFEGEEVLDVVDEFIILMNRNSPQTHALNTNVGLL